MRDSHKKYINYNDILHYVNNSSYGIKAETVVTMVHIISGGWGPKEIMRDK